jgi:hypothetical protein
VLLVPIAKTVGANLPGNQANLLVFITGLVCSTGMGMPVSGFPNQTACVLLLYSQESNRFSIRATQEDEMGQLYLTNVDFLKNGVPASVIAALVCFIRPLFENHSLHGTIGGRIAWLCADEAYWVGVLFLHFLSPRRSPV